MQFTREMQPGQVKIDLLAVPLGEFASRVKKDVRRVRPKPSVKLHTSKLEEAVGVDRDMLRIPVSGTLSNGDPHQTEVHPIQELRRTLKPQWKAPFGAKDTPLCTCDASNDEPDAGSANTGNGGIFAV